MPTAGWWETLWPNPAGVLEAAGLKPKMDAIDLCCGDGWFTSEMAKVARRVVAIDIDSNMLDVARDRLSKAGTTNCESWKATPTSSLSLYVLRLISCLWRTPFTASLISLDWHRLCAGR